MAIQKVSVIVFLLSVLSSTQMDSFGFFHTTLMSQVSMPLIQDLWVIEVQDSHGGQKPGQ